MRLSLTPMSIRRPAPLLGQHTEEILQEIKQAPPRRAIAPVDIERARQPMLAGLRMADLNQQYAGPLGTTILAYYYGMEAIKIESGVVASKERDTAAHADMNRGKLGCTINLRHPEGKELFKQLIAISDVVVDNSRTTPAPASPRRPSRAAGIVCRSDLDIVDTFQSAEALLLIVRLYLDG
jgi:crotonobetainyl-CoA:carnitine CoA-transferase CaiB-like acyl-CoA transferase